MMKLRAGWAALLCAAVLLGSAWAGISLSWETNGVLVATGLVPGTTGTVEWAYGLPGPFTNAPDALVADSAGTARLAVDTNAPSMFFRARGIPCPDGMVLVPGGRFAMGDPLDGQADALPVHDVQVGAFFMDATEVAKAQWDAVRAWALANGYRFDNPGSGKAPDHPVHTVNWYDAVKWCNARSELEGRTPVYTVEGVVYKTGQAAPDCDWDADGYRLPTEAEWEYAARGGLSGQRFPWGDAIDHNHANYRANGSAYDYDTSAYHTDTYHPAYAINPLPYTAPAASFAANGHGLHDMAGNVWEWCWDRYGAGYYAVSPESDPRGPSSGTDRTLRGGSWFLDADDCRTAARSSLHPAVASSFRGFRTVLKWNQ